MVNAVAKATTGEFEPLKAFGVSAQKESDGIAFSFRGLTTKVKNSTSEIEQYFIKLGEASFGDAMALRMNTLDGAISNLGDSWNQLFATISNQGVGSIITTVVRTATEAIDYLIVLISSGAIEGYIEAIGMRFETTFADIKQSIETISTFLSDSFKIMGIEGGDAANFIKESFLNLPHYVTSGVKVIGATLGLLTVYAEAVGKMVYEKLTAAVEYAGSTISNIITELMDQLNDPMGEGVFDYTAEQARGLEKFTSSVGKSFDDVKRTIDDAGDSYVNYVADLGDVHDTEVANSNSRIEQIHKEMDERKLWLAHEKDIADQERAFGRDRLNQFRQGNGDQARIDEEKRKRFESLQDSLVSEEQAVQNSYDRRLQLIKDMTVDGSAQESELISSLNERKLVELDGAHSAHVERLTQQYNAKQNMLQDSLDRQEITEKEFQEKSKANWGEYNKNVIAIGKVGIQKMSTMQMESYSTVLGFASDIAANMSKLAKENSDSAKALFVVSKAIAIAQAIVYTHLAAARAPAEAGPILGVPLATAILTLGYTNVGIMAATAIAGYEHGGMIPSGGVGLVGETGMAELVRGPAMVSSARTTADHKLADGSGSSNVVVNINNQAGGEATVTETEGPDGKTIEVLISRVKSSLTSDVRSGGSSFTKALESTYAVRRGAA
jgi:malonyl CoA-acyl carrier protein transacylase